jgi:hypothetical protein
MHLANASICACNCVCSAGGEGVGARLRQARAAALNVGEFLSIPCVFIRLLLSGSGKFQTPWLRMHAEYAFGSAEAPEGFGPVVVPICATLAPDEPPPQPAASRAEPVSSMATEADSAVRPARLREDALMFVDFIAITPAAARLGRRREFAPRLRAR